MATGLLAAAASRPAAAAQPAAPDDRLAIVNAIYVSVAKGKGDSGGTFVFNTRAARAKYLSRSLATLWAKADARTQKGDGGPVGFDPVTNSQDPDVKSFRAVAEKREPDKAVIAVTLTSHGAQRSKPADRIVRFDFVRDAGQWKIDDFRGAVDGEPWSIRAIIEDSFKY